MDESLRSRFRAVKDWTGCDRKIPPTGSSKTASSSSNCAGTIGSIRISGSWPCAIWLLLCGMLGPPFWKDLKMESLNCSCSFTPFKELISLGFMSEVDEDTFSCSSRSLSFSSAFRLRSSSNCFSLCSPFSTSACDDNEFCSSVCCDWAAAAVDSSPDVSDAVVWFEVITRDESLLAAPRAVPFADL